MFKVNPPPATCAKSRPSSACLAVLAVSTEAWFPWSLSPNKKRLLSDLKPRTLALLLIFGKRVFPTLSKSCYTKNGELLHQKLPRHFPTAAESLARKAAKRKAKVSKSQCQHDGTWQPWSAMICHGNPVETLGETMGKPKTQKEHSIDEPLARRSHEDRRFPILYAEATVATPASTASGTQIVTTKQPNSDLTRDKTRGKNGTSWNNFAILW